MGVAERARTEPVADRALVPENHGRGRLVGVMDVVLAGEEDGGGAPAALARGTGPCAGAERGARHQTWRRAEGLGSGWLGTAPGSESCQIM